MRKVLKCEVRIRIDEGQSRNGNLTDIKNTSLRYLRQGGWLETAYSNHGVLAKSCQQRCVGFGHLRLSIPYNLFVRLRYSYRLFKWAAWELRHLTAGLWFSNRVRCIYRSNLRWQLCVALGSARYMAHEAGHGREYRQHVWQFYAENAVPKLKEYALGINIFTHNYCNAAKACH